MKTISEMKKHTTDPVILADDQGVVTFVNKKFESVFGWKKNEIVGRPLTIIIPAPLHDAHHLGFSRFLTSGKPTLLGKTLRLKTLTKSGQEVESDHYILAEKTDGRWIFGATLKTLSAP